MNITRLFSYALVGCGVFVLTPYHLVASNSSQLPVPHKKASQPDPKSVYLEKGMAILAANILGASSDVVEKVMAGKPFEDELKALEQTVKIVCSNFYYVELWGIHRFFVWIDGQIKQIRKDLKSGKSSPRSIVLAPLARICSALRFLGVGLKKPPTLVFWDTAKIEKDLEPVVVTKTFDKNGNVVEPKKPKDSSQSSFGSWALNWFASATYIPGMATSLAPLAYEFIERVDEIPSSKVVFKQVVLSPKVEVSGLDRKKSRSFISVKKFKDVLRTFKNEKLYGTELESFYNRIKVCRSQLEYLHNIAPSSDYLRKYFELFSERLKCYEDQCAFYSAPLFPDIEKAQDNECFKREDFDLGAWPRDLVMRKKFGKLLKVKCEQHFAVLETEIKNLANSVKSLENEAKVYIPFKDGKEKVQALDGVISAIIDIDGNIYDDSVSLSENMVHLCNKVKFAGAQFKDTVVSSLNIAKGALFSQPGSFIAGAIVGTATVVGLSCLPVVGPVVGRAVPYPALIGGAVGFTLKNADIPLLENYKKALREKKESYDRMAEVMGELAEKHPAIFDYFLNVLKDPKGRKKSWFVKTEWRLSSAFVKLAEDMSLGSVLGIFDPVAQELLEKLGEACKEKEVLLAALKAFSHNWYASLFLKRLIHFVGERESVSPWAITSDDINKSKEAQKLFDFSQDDKAVIKSLDELFGEERILPKYLCLYMFIKWAELLERSLSSDLLNYRKKLESEIEKRKSFDGDPFNPPVENAQDDGFFASFIKKPLKAFWDVFWRIDLKRKKEAFDCNLGFYKIAKDSKAKEDSKAKDSKAKEDSKAKDSKAKDSKTKDSNWNWEPANKFAHMEEQQQKNYILQQAPQFFAYFFVEAEVPKTTFNERVRIAVKKGTALPKLCCDLKISAAEVVQQVATWWQLPPSYARWGSGPITDAQRWEDWYCFLGQCSSEEKGALCKQFGMALENQFNELTSSPRKGNLFLALLSGEPIKLTNEETRWYSVSYPFMVLKNMLLDGHNNDTAWRKLVDEILEGFPDKNDSMYQEIDQLCTDANITLSVEQEKSVKARIFTLLLREKIEAMADKLEKYNALELEKAEKELETFEKTSEALTNLPIRLNNEVASAMRRKQSLESHVHHNGAVVNNWKNDRWFLLDIYKWPLFWPRVIELIDWRNNYLKNERTIIKSMEQWEGLEGTLVSPVFTVPQYLKKLASDDKRLRKTFWGTAASFDPLLITSWFTRWWALHTNPFYARTSYLAAIMSWGACRFPELVRYLLVSKLNEKKLRTLDDRVQHIELSEKVREYREPRDKASLLRKVLFERTGFIDPRTLPSGYKAQIPSSLM